MASLWRHPHSKYWTACYTDHTGRQVKRSTKKTDRGDAMTVALEFERTERAARDGILTEAQCRRVLSDILEKTTGDTIRHVSTEAYLNEWLESYGAKPGTHARYENTVNLFLKQLGDRATRPITAIAPRHIQTFLNARQKSGRAPKTVIVDAKTLNTAFNLARRQGIITNNPVEMVNLPDLESSEREVFRSSQVGMLVDAVKGMHFGGEFPAQTKVDWRTVILLGYFIGARLSDCADMEWASIDLVEKVIRFEEQKTRHTRKKRKCVVVPIHEELEAHLQSIASTDKPEMFLCPTLTGKDSGGAHGLSATFKTIMKEAGIDTKTGKGKGTRNFSKLTFHSLRHCFNSALANAGVSQELRMKLTGHTTIENNEKYTHHELAVLRAAIGKLPPLHIVQ